MVYHAKTKTFYRNGRRRKRWFEQQTLCLNYLKTEENEQVSEPESPDLFKKRNKSVVVPSIKTTCLPLIKATGTAEEVPSSLINALSKSLPLGSSSSSYTVGLFPMPQKRGLMAWHLQQLLILKLHLLLAGLPNLRLRHAHSS
ncbi:hypothetical protein ACFX2J_005538 [Malus domestica]